MAEVLPSYVLDALFASLEPLRARLSQVWAKVSTTWTTENTKAAWFGALSQASDMLSDASIEGQRGQLLAMGEMSVGQWYAGPDAAADLVESVAGDVGLSGYSIRRLWREVVIPTATTVGQQLPKVPGAVIEWGPLVLGGLGLLWLWWNFAPRRGFSGWGGRRRIRG